MMRNHPHRGRSYWYKSANQSPHEYIVGIASTAEHALRYQQWGYERIDRERARHVLRNVGEQETEIRCSVMIDGQPAALTRFEVARGMKSGRLAA
jgi:hypothetical protein